MTIQLETSSRARLAEYIDIDTIFCRITVQRLQSQFHKENCNALCHLDFDHVCLTT